MPVSTLRASVDRLGRGGAFVNGAGEVDAQLLWGGFGITLNSFVFGLC